MLRKATVVVAVFAASALTLPVLLAQGGGEFYGTFKGLAFDGQTPMDWIFLRGKDGVPSVTAAMHRPKAKGGASIGRGPGRNVKLVGDVLEFEIEWINSQPMKGPAGAKYSAKIDGDLLTVQWVAGDQKGELTAKNPNPRVAKKPNPDPKQPVAAPERIYLSGLMDDRGIPAERGKVAQLGFVLVNGNKSTPLFLKATKDTQFIVTEGDQSKTFNQTTVLEDPEIRKAFNERFVMLERQANTALKVTATAVKKK